MAVSAIMLNTTEVASGFAGGAALAGRMEAARSRLEQRFLDGGAALLSILDILNKLVAALDEVTCSLDEQTANATLAELQQTIGKLAELSRTEAERQAGFAEIESSERNLRPHAESMQETMRYLRTFAVTAKITGAGIADFAGFAEEILERIRAGTLQVNDFGDKLQQLGAGLGTAIARGQTIVRRYDATIPGIVTELETGGQEILAQRKVQAERAARVRKIAAGIQNKLASALSAMQIGDITRQRIEHCQSSLALLDDYLACEGAELDAADRQGLAATVTHLVAAQLGQAIGDFDRDTAKIAVAIASFRSDLAQIDDLRRAMTEDGDGQDNKGETAMSRLEGNVGAARAVVREVEAVATEATGLSRSTSGIVRDLITGIGAVQLVRTEIHYMALNTNLRCGKIGEHGKALNVVTAELRNFAGALDGTAEEVLVELATLEKAADRLNATRDDGTDGTLDDRLDRAMQTITTVGDRMDAQIAALGDQSRLAVEEMDRSLARVDFKAELGEMLRGCANDIAVTAGTMPRMAPSALAADLCGRIAGLYTMASERELHASVLRMPVPVAAETRGPR